MRILSQAALQAAEIVRLRKQNTELQLNLARTLNLAQSQAQVCVAVISQLLILSLPGGVVDAIQNSEM